MRLVDVVAGLSRLADLGFGLPAGESLRSSALAALLARSLDVSDEDARAALYTALLRHVGCVGYAHETHRMFGDEFAIPLAAERANRADPRDTMRTILPAVARGRSRLEQLRLVSRAAVGGTRFGKAYDTASCEVGRDAARRLGLGDAVQRCVYHSFEWWDGRGAPAGLTGEESPMGSRIAAVASVATLFDSMGGADAAADAVRLRAGGILDPNIAHRFVRQAEQLLDELCAQDPYAVVIEAEPSPAAVAPDGRLVEVATVFGDIADLKTPHTHGHARGVAALAQDAGRGMGLSAADVADLEVAALLHDVGRVAISNMIWEKPGPLSRHEWEQVRLHAYHSERIVSASPHLRALAPLVGMHHERCDGSGYHRGATMTELSISTRILAVADAYQAMTQERAHRPALSPGQARQELQRDAVAGRLDGDAVAVVLAVAGHQGARVRRRFPAGLTAREVDVLRLLASGCSNKQIAQRLTISPRTAEHHVQQIYTKIGISSRAAAAMFAMEHHLLERQDP